MNLNFGTIIESMGADAAFRVANATTPGGEYLFNRLLPERNELSYFAESAEMTIKATMVGMVGMDSPYPPGGAVESSKFLEQTVKVAQTVVMPEAALRRLQAIWRNLVLNSLPTNRMLVEEALNFLSKVIVQPHLDTAEWLRGQALTTGAIDWTFNGIHLAVNYGVPAGNLFAEQTAAKGYGGTASEFWADIQKGRKLLRYGKITAMAHPDTIDLILGNPVNNITLMGDSGGKFVFHMHDGTLRQPVSDTRYRIELFAHGLEGSVLDPSDLSTVDGVPFLAPGYIVMAVESGGDRVYKVGQGGTDDATLAQALGYTHLAPTVEGDGRPGRWSDIDVPADRPWQLRGRGVTNLLPVIEQPKNLVVLKTAMS